MNVDLKDYLILGASLGNVFPWITIIYISKIEINLIIFAEVLNLVFAKFCRIFAIFKKQFVDFC